MNKITIIGRLVANPELHSTATGISVCKFRVAVNRKFDKDEADFFPVSVWRDAGLNCNKYLKKGSQVCVHGQLQIRNYEQDGVKKYAVDLIADDVEFLSYAEDIKNIKNTDKHSYLIETECEQGKMPF